MDWGRYDNDGPDGVPNSGDDDGFVDVLSVIHPTRGGECGGAGGGDRIWSHRWSLSAPFGVAYQTASPRTGGGVIRIDDYTIQPAVACSGGGLSEIGVFAHELGHAFGLPDLYDTDGGHSGAGSWDLMSSGSWGCAGDTPESPCHMGAWSKAALGWVEVVTLAPDTDAGALTLPPVATTDTVFRIDAQDGSGEYFLLENRQRVGFDVGLHEEGLLVWQVDSALVASLWAANRVNAGQHMGVRLRQADGEQDLDVGRGRGDAGDPFPGSTGNVAFHTASVPSSRTFPGEPSGLTVTEIAPVGDDVSLRVTTRRSTLTVRAEGTAGSDGLFTVDGADAGSAPVTITAYPFVEHTLEVVSGELVAPGERRPFLEWSDDATAPRARTVLSPVADTQVTARFGGTQYELALTVSGGVQGIEPASITSQPASDDLWFDAGTDVLLTAVPRTGFAFDGWSGALSGQANPAAFTMSTPISAGADFRQIFAVEEAAVALPAATPLRLQLESVEGAAPVRWRVVDGGLPAGVGLTEAGLLVGASLDLGSFRVTVEAVDASGLPATADVTFDFARPSIPVERLVATFLLGGQALEVPEIEMLNRQGNRYGTYDLGDLRAWLLADPGLPLSAGLHLAPDGALQGTLVLSPAAPGGSR
jgi:M6 family metalloprotease-like protein